MPRFVKGDLIAFKVTRKPLRIRKKIYHVGDVVHIERNYYKLRTLERRGLLVEVKEEVVKAEVKPLTATQGKKAAPKAPAKKKAPAKPKTGLTINKTKTTQAKTE